MPDRIMFFDVDGVLSVHPSCWGAAHAYFGVSDKFPQNMKAYRESQIDFPEWMRRDIGLWKERRPEGLNISELERIFASPRIVPGAESLLKYLKTSGYHIALVTLGFSAATYPVSDALGIPREDVYTNDFVLDEKGNLTGEPVANVYPHRKSVVARKVCDGLKIASEKCAAITDTGWDRDLLEFVGIGIAVGPKPEDEIRKVADYVIEEQNLSGVKEILESVKSS